MTKFLTKNSLGLFWAIVVVAILISAGLFLTAGTIKQNSSIKTVTIGSQAKIKAELAMTEAEKVKGLSGRKSLAIDSGMLFVFDDYLTRTFWMKDLNFPIDLIWIYDGQVVGIESNLLPAGSNPNISYSSQGPVNMALEVNGGWAEANAIKIGDVVVVTN